MHKAWSELEILSIFPAHKFYYNVRLFVFPFFCTLVASRRLRIHLRSERVDQQKKIYRKTEHILKQSGLYMRSVFAYLTLHHNSLAAKSLNANTTFHSFFVSFHWSALNAFKFGLVTRGEEEVTLTECEKNGTQWITHGTVDITSVLAGCPTFTLFVCIFPNVIIKLVCVCFFFCSLQIIVQYFFCCNCSVCRLQYIRLHFSLNPLCGKRVFSPVAHDCPIHVSL